MKTLFKKLFVALTILFSVSATANLTAPSSVYAANNNLGSCRDFLGLTSWDCGLPNINSQDTLTNGVVIIASNILTDLGVIAAYLVIGYVIYGGYLYIFSNGDAGKVMNAKKTLTRAFLGLAIVMLANVILNSIRIAFFGINGSFTGNCTLTESCVDSVGFVTNTINWFIGTAGVIALIYVFVGGIGYLTSAGDAGKLQKSKTTITYALIGLVIVALSLAITSFVSNIIRSADDPNTSYNNSIIIAKE